MDFSQALSLTFEPPDTQTFRALPLAYAAGKQGGTFPCVMNAANEVAVQAFIDGRIGFADLLPVVEGALSAHGGIVNPCLEELYCRRCLGASGRRRKIDRVGSK